MSETTIQARLKALLLPWFTEGSVLINDYRTPQIASRELAPWAIIALADEVVFLPGDSWSNPSATYGVFLNLVDYRRGRSDEAMLNDFQGLRQNVLAALIVNPLANRIEAATALGPYFAEDGEPDPDSIAQRFVIDVTDYEV